MEGKYLQKLELQKKDVRSRLEREENNSSRSICSDDRKHLYFELTGDVLGLMAWQSGGVAAEAGLWVFQTSSHSLRDCNCEGLQGKETRRVGRKRRWGDSNPNRGLNKFEDGLLVSMPNSGCPRSSTIPCIYAVCLPFSIWLQPHPEHDTTSSSQELLPDWWVSECV